MESFDIKHDPGLRISATSDFLKGISVTLLLFFVFIAAQTVTLFLGWDSAIEPGFTHEFIEELGSVEGQQALEALSTDGDTLADISLWSGLITSFVLLLLVFAWKNGSWSEVLPFRKFNFSYFFIFAGLFGAVAFLQQFILTQAGIESQFMEKVMDSVTNKTMLLLGVGIFGPILEELLLRGVALYSIQRISNEHVAVIVTSVVFALLHIQYETAVILSIIPLGLVLGYARVKSGSLILPILLHIVHNSMVVLFFDHL